MTHRKLDDDGVELSSEGRKDDYLARLSLASERARWVCAADKVHNGGTILADLRRTEYPETVWARFSVGQQGTVRWYQSVHERLRELGFDAPIMDELGSVALALANSAEPVAPARPAG